MENGGKIGMCWQSAELSKEGAQKEGAQTICAPSHPVAIIPDGIVAIQTENGQFCRKKAQKWSKNACFLPKTRKLCQFPELHINHSEMYLEGAQLPICAPCKMGKTHECIIFVFRDHRKQTPAF